MMYPASNILTRCRHHRYPNRADPAHLKLRSIAALNGLVGKLKQQIECPFSVLAVRSVWSSSCVKSPRTALCCFVLSELSFDFESFA
jgi:hypothetical protein